MKKLIITLMTIFLVGCLVGVANAGCPAGSYPSVDKWGNSICKSWSSGETNSIQGSIENCPPGTYRSIDGWGNPVCKSWEGNKQYHDTSKGCPAGTYPWTDTWGNSICKKY